MGESSERAVNTTNPWRSGYRNDNKDTKFTSDGFFARLDTTNFGASFTAICEEDIEKWMTRIGLLDPIEEDDDEGNGSLATWEYSTGDMDDWTTLKGTTTPGMQSFASNSSTAHHQTASVSRQRHTLPCMPETTGTQRNISDGDEQRGSEKIPSKGIPSFEDVETMILELWKSLTSTTDQNEPHKRDSNQPKSDPKNVTASVSKSLTCDDETEKKRSIKSYFGVWKRLCPNKFRQRQRSKSIQTNDSQKGKRWKMILLRRRWRNQPVTNQVEETKVEGRKDNFADTAKGENGDQDSHNGTSYFFSFVPEATFEIFNRILSSCSNDEPRFLEESKDACMESERWPGDRIPEATKLNGSDWVLRNVDIMPADDDYSFTESQVIDPVTSYTNEKSIKKDEAGDDAPDFVPLIYTPQKETNEKNLQPEITDFPDWLMSKDRCTNNELVDPQKANIETEDKETPIMVPLELGEEGLENPKDYLDKRRMPLLITKRSVGTTHSDMCRSTSISDGSLLPSINSFSWKRAQSTSTTRTLLNSEVGTYSMQCFVGGFRKKNKDDTLPSNVNNTEDGEVEGTFSSVKPGIKEESNHPITEKDKRISSSTRFLSILGVGAQSSTNGILLDAPVASKMTPINTLDCGDLPVRITVNGSPLMVEYDEEKKSSGPIEDRAGSTMVQKLQQQQQHQQDKEDDMPKKKILPTRPETSEEEKKSRKSIPGNAQRDLKEQLDQDEGFEAITKSHTRGKRKKKRKSRTVRPANEPASFPIKFIEFPSDFDVASDDRFGDDIEDPCIIYISARKLGIIDEAEEHGEVEMPLSDYLDVEAKASNEENSANAVVEYRTGILGCSALVLESTTDNDSVYQETKQWESVLLEQIKCKPSFKKMAMKMWRANVGSRNVKVASEEHNVASSGKQVKKHFEEISPAVAPKMGINDTWKESWNERRIAMTLRSNTSSRWKSAFSYTQLKKGSLTADTSGILQQGQAARDDSDQVATSQQSRDQGEEIIL
jgi:site-specific DNA-cytosine methylase